MKRCECEFEIKNTYVRNLHFHVERVSSARLVAAVNFGSFLLASEDFIGMGLRSDFGTTVLIFFVVG